MRQFHRNELFLKSQLLQENEFLKVERLAVELNKSFLKIALNYAFVSRLYYKQLLEKEGVVLYQFDYENLEKVTFYALTLSVPARRDVDDQEVLEGKQFFDQINCTACHVPKLQTGISDVADALSNQVIRPYTDMLLHYMGEGLADNATDFLATGNEWRTQPLWGIGLIETVNGHTNLLHDGRARNIEEAILWHGGEAEASKNAFMNLSVQQRDKVLKFINTL